jgi:hypothetical protein
MARSRDQVVNRKVWHSCSPQGRTPSVLHAADWGSRFSQTRKDERRIRTGLFFPFLQNAKSQIGERKRLGRSRRLYVVSEVDETIFPIHLVPTKPESLTVGSSSCLHEQNDANAKMGRCRAQDAVLLFQREHLFGRPLAQFVEMLYNASGIFGNVFALVLQQIPWTADFLNRAPAVRK